MLENIIGLLLTDFFPDEPCAVGLSLCPLGYRIPALESQFRNILLKGWSFLAEDMVGWFVISLSDEAKLPYYPLLLLLLMCP